MFHHAASCILARVGKCRFADSNHQPSLRTRRNRNHRFFPTRTFFYYLNRGKGIQRLIFGITSFLFAMRSHFLFQQVMCRLPKSTHPKWIVGHSFSESWLSILFVDWFRYSHDSLFLTFFIGHSSPSMDNPKHQTTN